MLDAYLGWKAEKKGKKGSDGGWSRLGDEDKAEGKQEEMQRSLGSEAERMLPLLFVGACFECGSHEHQKINCLKSNSGGNAGGPQGSW